MSDKKDELRQQAEAKLAATTDLPELSSQDSQTLIHELRTHQIELEMQNEELRRIEHTLTIARDKYSDLYDFSPVGYITINDKGLIQEVNLTLAELLGTDRNLLIKQPFSAFVVAEDQDAYYQHRKAVLTSSLQQCCEIQLQKKSGETFWARFESTAAQHADEAGQQLLMTISDISEQQKALEKSFELIQAIDQSGEGVMITNLHASIEYVNQAFTLTTGYSAEEAIGNNPSMLHSGRQDANFYRDMWSEINSAGEWRGKVWNKHKSGKIYPERLHINAIRGTDGKVTHYCGIFSDISEQISLEQRLLQAQKMEAIGTLVGGIAHDFNNMLAGITGNLYLAQTRTKDMPDVLDKLNSVEKLSFRAAAMIQQLLTFARKGQVDMKLLPLIPFIKETLKFMRLSIAENIDIHQHICSDAIQIKGDTTQLHQILMNLLTNARDALEEVENPQINISIEIFKPNERFMEEHPYFDVIAYAHLSVEDNGCGIPKAQLKHLFEPFFTTKEQGKGTGLGLAMVFGAIKTHHGFVEVESI